MITADIMALASAVLIILVFVLSLLFLRLITSRNGRSEIARIEQTLGDQQRFQVELAGRLTMLAEVMTNRQSDLSETLSTRVETLSHHLSQSVRHQTTATSEQIAKIGERLSVIDNAHSAVGDLSRQVQDLTAILGDKQARGLYGQGRMEAILGDCLPLQSFELQPRLSTGVRPDALVRLPGQVPPLVIDAKFPLEAFDRWLKAVDEAHKKKAASEIKRDVLKHIGDIHDRYLISGETHDTALMFLPAESLYATLHEHFPDLIQKALRLRVMIVSPSTTMLTIQLLQNMLRDYRVSEQAIQLRSEIDHLMEDIAKLTELVAKLRSNHDRQRADLDRIAALAQSLTKHHHLLANPTHQDPRC